MSYGKRYVTLNDAVKTAARHKEAREMLNALGWMLLLEKVLATGVRR